jgi:uncharacterized protein
VLIVDSGPLYAAASTSDRHHRRCMDLLSEADRPILVPALVVTEVAYFLGNRIGPHAEVAFARSIADAELVVEPVLDADWSRIVALMERYVDARLGVVDASVVALAERKEIDVIATLDHRHFAVVRPSHVGAFSLLP